jgi:hypothetical protein
MVMGCYTVKVGGDAAKALTSQNRRMIVAVCQAVAEFSAENTAAVVEMQEQMDCCWVSAVLHL